MRHQPSKEGAVSLSATQLEELKGRLEEEKEAVEANLKKGGYTLKENAGYGDHPADAASDVVAQMTSHGILGMQRWELKEITAALRRIEKWAFGKCERCGDDIPLEHLKLVPWARLCVKCAESARR